MLRAFTLPGTGACDDVTLSNSTLHAFALSPDAGLPNNYGVNLPASCNRWTVSDTNISLGGKGCVSDQSASSTFLRVNAHACGTASAGSAFLLRGANTTLNSSQATGASTTCVDLTGATSATVVSNSISGCAGAALSIGGSGTHTVKRNLLWDSNDGVTVVGPNTAAVHLSNNSVLGGRVDGGTTGRAYAVVAGGGVAIENNLSTGPMAFALSVQGYDAGTFPDGGPAASASGYVERANAFDVSSGQSLQWGALSLPPAQYELYGGDGGSFFGNPLLASTNPASPNFTLMATSPIRDIGVADPATGPLSSGCVGGFDSYCGTAPEPGAIELP